MHLTCLTKHCPPILLLPTNKEILPWPHVPLCARLQSLLGVKGTFFKKLHLNLKI